MRMKTVQPEHKDRAVVRTPAPPQALTATQAVAPRGAAATLLHWQRTQGNQVAQRRLKASMGGELLRVPVPLWQGGAPVMLSERLIQEQEASEERMDGEEKPLENKTGLPDDLKAGIEDLSGLAMDNVRVHYNSSKPAELQALAYTQGTDIFVGPGQERHLPHEAWHVVQQKEGRVKPTIQAQEVSINDDAGLEKEADVMGESATQNRTEKFHSPKRIDNSSLTIQAIMSVAEFQAATPAGFLKPRATVTAIDQALTLYIGAKTAANALYLIQAIQNYVGGRHDISRIAVANALLARAQQEYQLLQEIGDQNSFLVDGLIEKVGIANIALLIGLAHSITTANATQLPHLVTLAGGAANLAQLDGLIQHIQPANAYLLSGLIPLAGGAANLAQLDGLIQHIQPANTMLLFQLVPQAGGAPNLVGLDALIVAAGVAHVNLLIGMIVNAGGAGAVPLLTTAISSRHPGRGDLAQSLTTRANGNLVRFQELVAALPKFLQSNPPGQVPQAVTTQVNAYNIANPVGNQQLPFNRRIGRVNFDHFLTRHTYEYFDFNNISPVNDQWPFVPPANNTVDNVANVLVAALQHIAAQPVANWWIEPNAARQVNTGGFTSTVGVIVGGPNLPNPRAPNPTTVGVIVGGPNLPNPRAPNPTHISSVILGQFFPHPVGGSGVIHFDRDDMNAIRQLL